MDALTGMTRGVACTPQHLQSLVVTRKGIPEVTRCGLMGAQIPHVIAPTNDVGTIQSFDKLLLP